MHDRGPLRVDDADDAATDHLEVTAADADRGVLVNADAEPVRIERNRAEQPWKPAALAEVHVDEHPRHQPEPWRCPDCGSRHLGTVAAKDHGPAERRRASAGAA